MQKTHTNKQRLNRPKQKTQSREWLSKTKQPVMIGRGVLWFPTNAAHLDRFQTVSNAHTSLTHTNSFPTKWPSRVKVLKLFLVCGIFSTTFEKQRRPNTSCIIFRRYIFVRRTLSKRDTISPMFFGVYTVFFLRFRLPFLPTSARQPTLFRADCARDINSEESGEAKKGGEAKTHTHTHIYSHI